MISLDLRTGTCIIRTNALTLTPIHLIGICLPMSTRKFRKQRFVIFVLHAVRPASRETQQKYNVLIVQFGSKVLHEP